MIEVRYDRHHGRLQLQGHAGSAPKGEDLVCAAVSALCCTLAENLRKREDTQVLLEPGYARFQCRRANKQTRLLLDAFYLGLAALASQHPENIGIRRPKRL